MTAPGKSSVQIENLAKRYRLGAVRTDYTTLRDRIAGMFRRRQATPESREIWALRDITFDIGQGEALGLIGHNGAGKSTLLKILSRITEPTEGRAVLHGRVASLLEVGTGFHPELTGRENIFLNGAILGMTRDEIRRNFDAIVAFAEIERFLDTPVKRYSSGMYVRLAFAVAAHLTPEILLIDEVLAVGDVEFQRRCLGRMREVASSGRTVVFVSHNLDSIERLCSRAVLLSRGSVERIGPSSEVIAHYLSRRGKGAVVDLTAVDRIGEGRARITGFEVLDVTADEPLDALELRQPFRVRIHYEVHDPIPGASFGFGFLTAMGDRIFLTETFETGKTFDLEPGPGRIDCIIRTPNVLPGTYRFELWISDIPGVRATDHLQAVGEIEVTVGMGTDGNSVATLTSGVRGIIHVDADWSPLYSGAR
ncbi:MAG TPA: ABC transporter ATP-binding protein [Thermoanaerobaculia bacterium]|nr:ABC transporter ATP-binding protein [Thermoanaerobaculia bacterium]